MAKAKQDRSMLNTTINKYVLDEFRNYCKSIGCPMNMILEAFMMQFSGGEFTLKLGKNNKMEVDIEE